MPAPVSESNSGQVGDQGTHPFHIGMDVPHGGADVGMAQQLLKGPNVTLGGKQRGNPRYKGTSMREEQVSGFFSRLSQALSGKISPHRLRHTIEQGDVVDLMRR